jgi:hypothetical protein
MRSANRSADTLGVFRVAPAQKCCRKPHEPCLALGRRHRGSGDREEGKDSIIERERHAPS